MKYYKLKRDLPTFKAGEIFFIDDYGNLNSCNAITLTAYSRLTLEKFPNILKDWFEPITDNSINEKSGIIEPIIKDEKIRKAVRAWAKVNDASSVSKNNDYGLTDSGVNSIDFCKDVFTKLEYERSYTIIELCGEEVPEPERDGDTKEAFVIYLSEHKDERFFQAIRNFTRKYLDDGVEGIYVSRPDEDIDGCYEHFDTFYWECDKRLKLDDEK